MPLAFKQPQANTVVTAGINRVLGKPAPAVAIPQAQPALVAKPSPLAMGATQPLTQVQPPVIPQELEIPVAVDMKQFANPLADLAVQGTFEEFEQFPKDCKTPAGVVAYYLAYLPPSKMSTNNDPVLSVRYLFSNGEARKRTEWFALKTDPKSNLSKFWGSYIPNWQMLQYDEHLFTTGFDIITKDVYKNGMLTKYSEIQEVYLNPQVDVSGLAYDIEYIPCQYVKAWGKKVPCVLAVIKGSDGQIHRYEFNEMVTEEQAEAMKKLRKQQQNEEPDAHE